MRALALAGCLVVLTLSHRAAADERADMRRAKDAFRAGAAAYAAGEFLAAIQALETAYELTPLPAIAFSLAQAERRQYFVQHEREHLERAIELFRLYVQQVPSGGRRADALDALSQLEPLAARLTSSATSPETKTPPTQRPSGPTITVRRTRLLVASETPGARISLDGGPAQPSPLVREVKPGRHRVEVSAPGFHATRRQISAVSGELIAVTVPLRERPSTLGIWTAPDSEIYVDGVFVSPGGDGVVLQVPSGTHQVAVAKNGYRVATQTVHSKRGGAETIRIVLEPTSQRTASKILFISGAAALSGALVLSALAVRQENDAEDFLAERTHGNVTNSDLLAFHSSITNRDRYRVAATVSAVSALGLWVTGLFVHELDQPRRQDLYRAAGPRPPEPPKKQPPQSSVSVAPIVGPAQFGAALGGHF